MSANQFTRIRAALNAAPSTLATALNTFFTSQGPLDLKTIEFNRATSARTAPLSVDLTYADPGVMNYTATYLEGANAAALDAAVAAFFTTNPDARVWHLLDVSPERRRTLARDAVILITADDLGTPCGVGGQYSIFVAPILDILPGASGDAEILGAGGGTGTTVTVRNNYDFTWAAGDRGSAVLDPLTCAWQGFPSCCSAPP